MVSYIYYIAINANYCSSAASTITKPNQTADQVVLYMILQENQDIFIFRNAIILHVKFKVKKYESLRSRAKNRTIYFKKRIIS